MEPEIEAPPEYTELDAAHDQISELQAELVVARMGDIPEEEKQQAAGLIAELHAEIKTLNATLAAVTLSRDTLVEGCPARAGIGPHRRPLTRAGLRLPRASGDRPIYVPSEPSDDQVAPRERG